MELYPVVKMNNIDFPRCFPDVLSKNYLQLNEEYAFEDIRTSKASNCEYFSTLKTDHPIPRCCGIYYFEIRLLVNETLGFIGLGIGNSRMEGHQQLGKGMHSTGLYLTNGRSVSLWLADKEYPINISEKTRVQTLGIGVNYIDNYVFCTVNGILLLHRKELPSKEKYPTDALYPAVSSQSPKCSFIVNLGENLVKQPFAFHFQHYKDRELKKKRNSCLSQQYSPNLAFLAVSKLVSGYLFHHGYAEAWEALNKYDDSQNKDQSLETIKQRRLIQKSILDQDFLAAITNIKMYFPDFFTHCPIYKFILKCRHFINLIVRKPILGSDIDDQDDFGTSPKFARLDPLLIKHKHHAQFDGQRKNAAITMESMDDCQVEKENGFKCLENAKGMAFSTNNNHDDERMEVDCCSESVVDRRNVNGSPSSCSHLAAEHVMYIIQYGKKLKEESQRFYPGAQKNSDYRDGLNLLTTAFSLIAYRDPYGSPFKDVLGTRHMEDLAHKINGAINGMLGKTTRAPLDSLLDNCLSNIQDNCRSSPILASIHPKLLVSELFLGKK